MSDPQPVNTAKSAAAAYFADLKAVDEYIASAHFAHVTKFTTPFSEQVKADVRNRLNMPEDVAIYDKADDLQRQSAKNYVWLRATTGLLFAAFIASGIVIRHELIAPLTKLLANPPLAHLIIIASVLLCGLVCWGFRQGARWYVLDYRIGATVRDLAVVVLAKFNKLESDTKAACGKIDERADFDTNLGWAKRAYGWAKIALWNATRTRGLDTYTTTVFWKMRVFDTDIERISRLCKGGLLLVGLFVLFDAEGFGKYGSESDFLILLSALLAWGLIWYLLFIRKQKRIPHKWYKELFVLSVTYGAWTGVWFLWGGRFDVTTTVIGALFIIFFWFGWIVSGERDDNDWADIFASKLGQDQVARMNTAFYFDSIGKRVENLIEEIRDEKRLGSQRGGAPKSSESDD